MKRSAPSFTPVTTDNNGTKHAEDLELLYQGYVNKVVSKNIEASQADLAMFDDYPSAHFPDSSGEDISGEESSDEDIANEQSETFTAARRCLGLKN